MESANKRTLQGIVHRQTEPGATVYTDEAAAYMGIYHHLSSKRLFRYAAEFEGRHNNRPLDTEAHMVALFLSGIGKRLKYEDLIGPPHTRLNTQIELM